MGWLELIGIAFLCGMVFAAFIAPLAVFLWWLSGGRDG